MPAVLSLRVIRRKIRSVQNIKKITRAMQMVSAAKLRKVQDRLLNVRPYSDKVSELLGHLAAHAKDLSHPYFLPHDKVKKVAVVAITADKGLCGPYNANVFRHTERLVKELDRPTQIFAIGRKAADYFPRRGFDVAARHVLLPIHVPFEKIREMTRPILRGFLDGQYDEVYLAYTHYVNAMTFRPSTKRFLPIEPPKGEAPEAEVIFEPKPKEILDRLTPLYVQTQFHRLLLESFSSEHAARMNAMKNATDNAQELIEQLTLTANKVRQTQITKELLDIVGGAEALKGSAA